MTDLEMTRLCAEAMEIEVGRVGLKEWSNRPYDPLHNDAQAMALVKKARITTVPHHNYWYACCEFAGSERHEDLNRAIVECVAKMQVGRNAK